MLCLEVDPPSTGRDNASLPELGTKAHAKGAKLRVKDALMRTFGMGWKNADVEGEVIAKPRKKPGELDGTLGVSFMKLNMVQRFGGMLKNPSQHQIPLQSHQLSHKTAGLKLMKRMRVSIMMLSQCVRT